MEYDHERAVAVGVNVDFEVYGIRTRITGQGATIEATPDTMVEYRDRQTRRRRWERPDDDITYDAGELDRRVVARDQIRTVVRTFRDRLFTDLFPGRTEVPKTLVFAKDDSHAEDIVEIVRDEFGRGNAFCQKITYRVTGAQPRDLIQAFRNGFEPRIAVTVDMISTGADIKPIEIVLFLRAVRSRVLFEQMKGRGVRVIDARELRAVTPDARAKTHFVIVDCVGMAGVPFADTQPLERRKTVPFKALLDHVAMGGTDPATLSSLAGRLARLDRQCGPEERRRIAAASGGAGLAAINRAIVDGLDPDRQIAAARTTFRTPAGDEPTAEQVRQAADALLAGDDPRPRRRQRSSMREIASRSTAQAMVAASPSSRVSAAGPLTRRAKRGMPAFPSRTCSTRRRAVKCGKSVGVPAPGPARGTGSRPTAESPMRRRVTFCVNRPPPMRTPARRRVRCLSVSAFWPPRPGAGSC